MSNETEKLYYANGDFVMKHPVHNPNTGNTTMGFQVCSTWSKDNAEEIARILNQHDHFEKQNEPTELKNHVKSLLGTLKILRRNMDEKLMKKINGEWKWMSEVVDNLITCTEAMLGERS